MHRDTPYFSVNTIPNQVVYETNADYDATWENLTKNPLVVVDTCKERCGTLWFRLKGTKTVFILSPYGRLQVKWECEDEKKVLFEIVKNLLIPKDSTLKIKPLKQQVWINYPEPENFKLYWCKEETEYVKSKLAEQGITIETEEPIPVLYALMLMQKYPIKQIRQKRSLWRKIRDFLNTPIDLRF
jgi:hypothetical protein